MEKIREIVRLHEKCSFSLRKIELTLNVSRPKVTEVIRKICESGYTFEKIKTMSDLKLLEILSPQKAVKNKAESLAEKFPEYIKELKKPGVTIQLLWEEYIKENPDGLKSTQFGTYFQKWRADDKISMHIDHIAGDKMFIDYTGKKMEYLDLTTGQKVQTEIYVSILPASQLTYAEASISQNQEDFMRSTERAIWYYGGVPSALVPDNLKSGVIKANIWEPQINPLFADFAEYYRTAVLPARARKPKDKAHVENAVKIIYTRIFAPLRNEIFYSLEELNKAILIKLEDHNNRKLSKMTVSRRQLFEEVEKKELKMLPVEPYPHKEFQNGRAGFNYHIELKEDKHYYSVPYLLRGKEVKLIYDDRNVAIIHNNMRIVQYRRNRQAHKYTTKNEHMPDKHRFAEDWNPDKFKWWAGNIGEQTQYTITHILESKKHPEQAYKSCMGILSLAKKYGNDLLELACRKAINIDYINYGYISDEIKKIQEQYKQKEDSKQMSLLLERHENIRGKECYK